MSHAKIISKKVNEKNQRSSLIIIITNNKNEGTFNEIPNCVRTVMNLGNLKITISIVAK